MDYPIIIGKATVYATIQIAFANFIMGSVASIKTRLHTTESISIYRDYLKRYLIVALIYSLGTSVMLYETYHWKGAIIGFIANAIMVIWILYFYHDSIAHASKNISTVPNNGSD